MIKQPAINIMLIVGLVLPSFVMAHPGHPEELLDSYCARLLVFEVQDAKKVADIEKAYANKEKARFKEIQTIRAKQDKAIVSFVEDMDKKIASYIEELKNSAKSEAVLTQLGVLNDQIYALTRERNTKIQQIVADYRSGINDLMVARKAAFVTAEGVFKNATKKVLAKSKEDCKNKRDVKEIFAEVTTNLKAAHETLKDKIAKLGTSPTSLKKLADARDAAWDTVAAEYKQKVAEAINAFKVALPQ